VGVLVKIDADTGDVVSVEGGYGDEEMERMEVASWEMLEVSLMRISVIVRDFC